AGWSQLSSVRRTAPFEHVPPTSFVRRQIIWRSLGLGLAEYRPRLWVDVMRRACGAASADAGWFVV
ncbi:hypothetical protein ACFPLB_01315, partial [Aquamicrobium segne]